MPCNIITLLFKCSFDHEDDTSPLNVGGNVCSGYFRERFAVFVPKSCVSSLFPTHCCYKLVY